MAEIPILIMIRDSNKLGDIKGNIDL